MRPDISSGSASRSSSAAPGSITDAHRADESVAVDRTKEYRDVPHPQVEAPIGPHRRSCGHRAADLARPYDDPGSHHGFSVSLPPAPVPIGSFDSEKACVTALNIGPGPSTLLGCYPLIYQPII